MVGVSVVIPAYNEEDCIGRCLDRLSSQLGPRDELIVLDNGSTDRTGPIAEAFDAEVVWAPDDRFDNDNHYRGLASLRQFGAEQASNEIVATTDADTIPPDDWIDRIKAHFEDDPDLNVLWGTVQDTSGIPVRNLTGKYLTFVGGVSGSNTAFRRSAFEELKKGYLGWPMFEDVAVITRLARTGKAVHDTGLVMHTDLERSRYQTIPVLATSAAGTVAGAALGGPVGALAIGTSGGLATTETFYEESPDSRLHHDQLGLGLITIGAVFGGAPGILAAGLGTGVLGHHLLTEGATALPTGLMRNTDRICAVPDADGDVTVQFVCEPADEGEARLTRLLMAVAIGAVGGRAMHALRQ